MSPKRFAPQLEKQRKFLKYCELNEFENTKFVGCTFSNA